VLFKLEIINYISVLSRHSLLKGTKQNVTRNLKKTRQYNLIGFISCNYKYFKVVPVLN
jgi:hypothetical protein